VLQGTYRSALRVPWEHSHLCSQFISKPFRQTLTKLPSLNKLIFLKNLEHFEKNFYFHELKKRSLRTLKVKRFVFKNKKEIMKIKRR